MNTRQNRRRARKRLRQERKRYEAHVMRNIERWANPYYDEPAQGPGGLAWAYGGQSNADASDFVARMLALGTPRYRRIADRLAATVPYERPRFVMPPQPTTLGGWDGSTVAGWTKVTS